MTTFLPERLLWLLAIIDSMPYVDGSTRLQKYALLASKIILKDKNTYADWESNHFGAFSPDVREDMNSVITDNLVLITKVSSTYYGDEHNRYSISGKGKEALQIFKEKNKDIINRIKVLTDFYFKKSLDDLLVDAYTLFPEYTEKSKIKALVRRTWLNRESKIGSNYKLPFTEKKFDFSVITSTAEINPFMYNDEKIRKKLAEEVGLKEIPKLDINAYDELSDIFADKEFLKDVDLSKKVKELRLI